MTKVKEIQYSIIIPHYNTPALLRRCLWSIPRREELQILVVDDKSDDEYLLELNQLENDYPHVTFIYSEKNGGGGSARNIGLKYAEGNYVLFADADDFFNYCIADVLDKYIKETCDIVFFNATYIDTETYLSTERTPILNILMCKYARNHDTSGLQYMFGEPWCKLIRRSLIEKYQLRFDETPIHNDTRFSYMVGFYAKDIKVDNRGLYCLADRSRSVSKAISDYKMEVRLRVFSEKNKFFKDNKMPFFDNLMIVPFDYYLMRGDLEKAKKCFAVAAEYNFSKYFVWKKYIKYKGSEKIRRFLSRIIKLLYIIETLFR